MRPARILAMALAAALAGCATPPQIERPQVETPAAWRDAPATPLGVADLPWGELFRTPELTALIDEALRNNRDLRIAAERIEFARARYGIERSFLFPSVAADAAYTRSREPSPFSPDNTEGEVTSLGLAVPIWEIDLWGRIRSLTEAARRDLLASVETRRALETTLVSEVALGYLDLLDLDAELAVAEDTARTRRESLRLVSARFRGGIVSALDLRQAEALLASAEQTIADLKRRIGQTENALSVLLGRNPGPIARSTTLSTYPTLPQLPAGLPSALLERRPDIRAAEQALASTQANVDAARKAFFPTISLTAFLGFISPAFAALLESGRSAWSITPAVTLPIFTAGRLEANLEAAQSQQRIALERYVQAVQIAFREVEDALVAYQRLSEQREAQVRVVMANRERLRLSELRYKGGVADYSEVLDSQRDLFNSELALVQTTRGYYASVVQAYRALGGGWDRTVAPVMPPPAYGAASG